MYNTLRYNDYNEEHTRLFCSLSNVPLVDIFGTKTEQAICGDVAAAGGMGRMPTISGYEIWSRI